MRRSPTFVALSLIAIVALATPLHAQAKKKASASRWTEIGTTSAGNAVFVDLKTVKREGAIVHAQVRVLFKEPVKTPKGDWASSRTVAMFDCAKKTTAAKENFYFSDARGTKVVEHKVNKIPGFGSPIKGTMPDVAMAHLCKAK
jgi:hypothetical protein